MALSEGFVDQHISHWSEQLGKSYYSYRKHWPARLFHHAPLETALAIIDDGHLRSRNDPKRKRFKDVAAEGVIENRREAHERVRLYFRPRNPTQFHIEGIRKDSDCQYGANAHAPILVMFVLDAKRVLTREGVAFSDRNMQKNSARLGCDEEFFASIPFESVFHEGGIAGDYSIIERRCAEVLPISPLPLAEVLSGIWFRSEPERDTFLHKLGAAASHWRNLCSVSEELKVFDKRFTFVADISLSANGVLFRLNHRHDLAHVSVTIQVFNSDNEICINFHNRGLPTFNQFQGRWIHKSKLNPGVYLVRVKLENHEAYEAMMRLDASLF